MLQLSYKAMSAEVGSLPGANTPAEPLGANRIVPNDDALPRYKGGSASALAVSRPGTIRRWVQTGNLDDSHAESQSEIMSQSHTIRISKDALEAYCDENGIIMKSCRDDHRP